MIKLLLPVRDVFITQPFGVNYFGFYQQLGMIGHNGIDFRAKHGCPLIASNDGIVIWASKDNEGGIGVEIFNKEKRFKILSYHLSGIAKGIQKGVKVTAGEIVGYANNTGKYTSGDHDHFGMKFTDDIGNTINKENGFKGAVDPAIYFENMYGKDWYKPAAYHRYGRQQNWIAEWMMRFKNIWLHKQLIKLGQLNKIYDTEFINALIYGGWDFETVINPAMHEIWGYLTKVQYNEGARPFSASINL